MQQHSAGFSPQIQQIEAVRAPSPAERIRNVSQDSDTESFEIVLHIALDSALVLDGFQRYAAAVGVEADMERRIDIGGLAFVPVTADPSSIPSLARFAFLRVARPMPRLRGVPALERARAVPGFGPCALPSQGPVDPDLRIAVFDGGLDPASQLVKWATPFETPGVGEPIALDHGHAVTSALLFGNLTPGEAAPQPYARVDHYRVLDKDAETDPYELYDVLRRIDGVLAQRSHEFFSLSLGPYVSIEDDEVHPWTALLDSHLSSGTSLATLAVGNNGGEASPDDQRIQIPSDCVNGLSIGAADTERSDWDRASYSAKGPGRSPGRVKPDLMSFGGEGGEQFVVYDSAAVPNVAAICGTSFGTPSVLRMAAGSRAHFGSRLSPLALKALLVHASDKCAFEDRDELGWGRAPQSVEDVVVCPDGSVRVVYQGELQPGKFMRAPIPLPAEPLTGMVTVAATFCYASPVDPEDPGTYTRCGLDVIWRPHSGKFSGTATEPVSKSFFRRTDYDNEAELRRDAMKWDTVRHAEQRYQPASLLNPMFDIHYNLREGGGPSRTADKLRYALVVSITAPRTPGLYDGVVRAYAGILEALQPVVPVPIRV